MSPARSTVASRLEPVRRPASRRSCAARTSAGTSSTAEARAQRRIDTTPRSMPSGDRRRADEGGGQGKDRRAQHRPAPRPGRGDELGEGRGGDEDGSGHEHARQHDEERDQREVRGQQEQRRGRGGEERRLDAQGRLSGESAVAEPDEAGQAEQAGRDERQRALPEADDGPIGLEDLRPEVVRRERRRQLARLGHVDQVRHDAAAAACWASTAPGGV